LLSVLFFPPPIATPGVIPIALLFFFFFPLGSVLLTRTSLPILHVRQINEALQSFLFMEAWLPSFFFQEDFPNSPLACLVLNFSPSIGTFPRSLRGTIPYRPSRSPAPSLISLTCVVHFLSLTPLPLTEARLLRLSHVPSPLPFISGPSISLLCRLSHSPFFPVDL